MFNQQLVDFLRFIVHHPVGGIFEYDQTARLTQIHTEGGHFVADMGILLPPEDECRYTD